MRTVMTCLAVLLALPVLCQAAPNSAHLLSIKREGDRLFLLDGKARLDLQMLAWPSAAGDRAVSLSENTSISQGTKYGTIIVRRGSKSTLIDLKQATSPWFAKDEIWGGHKQANNLRGTQKNEGLQAILWNLTPAGTSALGVISWNSVAGSGNAIKAQLLVRIRTQPEPAIEPLYPLDLPPNTEWIYGFAEFPCRRLFKVGSHLLLVTEVGDPAPFPTGLYAALVEIDRNGKHLKTVGHFQANHYPVGILKDRWLVLLNSGCESAQTLWMYDLKKKRERLIPGNWKGVAFSDYLNVPSSGSTFIVAKPGPDSGLLKSYLITVPTGKPISVSNPSGTIGQLIWRKLAVIEDTNDKCILVYSIETGHLIRKLPIPPKAPVKKPAAP